MDSVVTCRQLRWRYSHLINYYITIESIDSRQTKIFRCVNNNNKKRNKNGENERRENAILPYWWIKSIASDACASRHIINFWSILMTDLLGIDRNVHADAFARSNLMNAFDRCMWRQIDFEMENSAHRVELSINLSLGLKYFTATFCSLRTKFDLIHLKFEEQQLSHLILFNLHFWTHELNAFASFRFQIETIDLSYQVFRSLLDLQCL